MFNLWLNRQRTTRVPLQQLVFVCVCIVCIFIFIWITHWQKCIFFASCKYKSQPTRAYSNRTPTILLQWWNNSCQITPLLKLHTKNFVSSPKFLSPDIQKEEIIRCEDLKSILYHYIGPFHSSHFTANCRVNTGVIDDIR